MARVGTVPANESRSTIVSKALSVLPGLHTQSPTRDQRSPIGKRQSTTNTQDCNLIEAEESVDWDKYFESQPLELQFDPNLMEHSAEASVDSDYDADVSNPNPKSGFHPKPPLSGYPIETTVWENKGTVADVPYESRKGGVKDGSRQAGCQPGDQEWEDVETSWERKLREKGFTNVMAEYAKEEPKKYSLLHYGPKPPKARPRSGEDSKTVVFNNIMKAFIPTVAFKLTQQHFDLPTSPLNGQEPDVRGGEPRKWLEGNNYGEIVYHQEKELEFLDFYNEKSHGDIMIRSKSTNGDAFPRLTYRSELGRKLIPDEFIHREEPYRAPVFDGSALPQQTNGSKSTGPDNGSGITSKQHNEDLLGARFALRGHTNPADLNFMSKRKGRERNFVEMTRLSRRASIQLALPPTRQSIFAIARKLFPNVKGDLTVRLLTQRHLRKGDLGLVAHEVPRELELDEQVERMLYEEDSVFIVMCFSKIQVLDGTDRTPGREVWPMRELNGVTSVSEIMERLSQISQSLLGVDPSSPDAEKGGAVKLQVNRYKKEWLWWRPGIRNAQFLAEVLWMIDDPVIAIYPRDWIPTSSFEDAEHEREHLVKTGSQARPNQPRASSPVDLDHPSIKRFGAHERTMKEVITNLEDKQKSRLMPEIVYQPAGRIKLPRYGPSFEQEIRAGNDLPSFYPRVLTVSETIELQRQLLEAQNEILQREESCRVCGKTFNHGNIEFANEILDHYKKHRNAERQLCPICHRSWAEQTISERHEHLLADHPELSIQEPARSIRDPEQGLCPFEGCETNLANGVLFGDFKPIFKHFMEHAQNSIKEAIAEGTINEPGVRGSKGSSDESSRMAEDVRREHVQDHAVVTRSQPAKPLSPEKPRTPKMSSPSKGPFRSKTAVEDDREQVTSKMSTLRQAGNRIRACPKCFTQLNKKIEKAHLQKCGVEPAGVVFLTRPEIAGRKKALEQQLGAVESKEEDELAGPSFTGKRKRKPTTEPHPTHMKRSKRSKAST